MFNLATSKFNSFAPETVLVPLFFCAYIYYLRRPRSVGRGYDVRSISLFVCLYVCPFVCPEHNSKTNDPKVLKFGVENDLGIS